MSTLTPGFLASCFILSGSVRCYAPHTPVCSHHTPSPKKFFYVLPTPPRTPRQTGANRSPHSAVRRAAVFSQINAHESRDDTNLHSSDFTVHTSPSTYSLLSFLSFEFDTAQSQASSSTRGARALHTTLRLSGDGGSEARQRSARTATMHNIRGERADASGRTQACAAPGHI